MQTPTNTSTLAWFDTSALYARAEGWAMPKVTDKRSLQAWEAAVNGWRADLEREAQWSDERGDVARAELAALDAALDHAAKTGRRGRVNKLLRRGRDIRRTKALLILKRLLSAMRNTDDGLTTTTGRAMTEHLRRHLVEDNPDVDESGDPVPVGLDEIRSIVQSEAVLTVLRGGDDEHPRDQGPHAAARLALQKLTDASRAGVERARARTEKEFDVTSSPFA